MRIIQNHKTIFYLFDLEVNKLRFFKPNTRDSSVPIPRDFLHVGTEHVYLQCICQVRGSTIMLQVGTHEAAAACNGWAECRKWRNHVRNRVWGESQVCKPVNSYETLLGSSNETMRGSYHSAKRKPWFQINHQNEQQLIIILYEPYRMGRHIVCKCGHSCGH